MKKLNKKGFTIVELVIVIAVIGILAGVLIPTFTSLVNDANESAAMQKADGVELLLRIDDEHAQVPNCYILVEQKDKVYVFEVANNNLSLEPVKVYDDVDATIEEIADCTQKTLADMDSTCEVWLKPAA